MIGTWAHWATTSTTDPTTGTVTTTTAIDNVIVLDPDTAGDYPMDNLIEITSMDPVPGIGWTTADDGATWDAPPPPPDPAPTP